MMRRLFRVFAAIGLLVATGCGMQDGISDRSVETNRQSLPNAASANANGNGAGNASGNSNAPNNPQATACSNAGSNAPNTPPGLNGSCLPTPETVYVGAGEYLKAFDVSDGTEEWSTAIGLHSSSPTVANGTVYVGSDVVRRAKNPGEAIPGESQFAFEIVEQGKVYALSASDGSVEWSYGLDGSFRSSPTIVDGTVYVGASVATSSPPMQFWDGAIYALKASDGSVEWSHDVGGAVISSPTVVNGVLYAGSYDGTLYALDRNGGRLEWSYDTGAPIWSSPTVVNGTVYVGNFDGELLALDAGAGSLEWTHDTGEGLDRTSPSVVDGTVYVPGGSFDESRQETVAQMYALDAANGSVEWTHELSSPVNSSPTIADGTVFIGTIEQTLYALDANGGSLVWSYDTGHSVSLVGLQRLPTSSPTVAAGTVYFGRGQTLHALDTGDGSVVWSSGTGATIRHSSPTVSGDGDSIGSRNMLRTFGHNGRAQP